MSVLGRGLAGLRRILGMPVEEEVASELEFHVDMRIRELEAQGFDPAAARQRALQAFGNRADVERICRRIAHRRNRKMRRVEWWSEFRQDVRFAARQFRRSPGFTAVAVLTLALGIGANSAIFTAVNGVLLKPLPYRAPDELVFINSQFPGLGFEKFWVSPAEYRELQEHTRSFAQIGAWRTGSASISGIENPVRVTSAGATAELFATLGVNPVLGRPYTEDEDADGAAEVAVISSGLWRSAFGSDAGIVGKSIEVNRTPTTIVGVMPDGFDVEDAGVDLWVPLQLAEDLSNQRASHYLNLVGRLKPGVTLAQAQGDIGSLLSTRWREIVPAGHVPNDSTHRVLASGLREEFVGDARASLLILLAAVGLVLLIACANVANLQLARAEARQKEITVRAALGAGRMRLVRQFLTESVLLASAGGALGLFLGYAGVRTLVAINPDGIPRSGELGLDGNVVLFTVALSLFTGVLFGLAPLLHLSNRSMSPALRSGGQRTTATAARWRLRRLLMGSEVAFAVILVIGAGLLLRSLSALQKTDPGFEPDNILTFELFLPSATYPEPADAVGFFRNLQDRLESIPGVAGMTAMTGLPPLREVNANDTEFEGLAQTEDGPAHNVDYYQTVIPEYFETMQIPIVRGRGFEAADEIGSPVIVVNEQLARTFYPDQDPIGRRMRPCCGDDVPWATIVGVAKDVKQGGISERTGTEMYFYYPQAPAYAFAPRQMNVVLRTNADPLGATAQVRRVIREIDPALPLASIQTMEANIAGSMSRTRFLTMLLGIFAAVALLLAAVGTYGVLSYSVAERNREIGIRMMLGARAASVLRMVLRDGLAVAALGVVIGIAGAYAGSRLLESVLYGVTTTDPRTFMLAPAILVFVAALACYIPARRATRVDPAVTLRAE